jgi:arylsulfatase A-like enzyme
MNDKKNILFIIVDCLRADFIYESKRAFIPNITKLKNEGFSFLNTIATTSTTVPNFVSLFTGLYPFEHGVRSQSGYRLKDEFVTLQEILKENGYNTYAEFTGPLVKEIGLSKGFNEYNHRNVKNRIHTKWGKELIYKFKNHYEKPWFVCLHIWSLHLPRIVLRECNSKNYGLTIYGRSLSSIDKYLAELLNILGDDTFIIIIGDHGEKIAYSKFEYYKKRVTKFIFRRTKRLSLAKKYFYKGLRNILIGHGYGIYDELVKTPFILHNNELIDNGLSDIQIRQIDIFPTILDILNINFKQKITGISAFPIIQGKDKYHRDAYIEAVGVIIPSKDEWLSGLRIDNKYKFIYAPFNEEIEDELYFLSTDPEERHSVAKDNKKLVDKFKNKIKNMKTERMIGEKIDEDTKKRMMGMLKDLGYMD